MKQKIARYFGLQNKPSSGATKVATVMVEVIYFGQKNKMLEPMSANHT